MCRRWEDGGGAGRSWHRHWRLGATLHVCRLHWRGTARDPGDPHSSEAPPTGSWLSEVTRPYEDETLDVAMLSPSRPRALPRRGAHCAGKDGFAASVGRWYRGAEGLCQAASAHFLLLSGWPRLRGPRDQAAVCETESHEVGPDPFVQRTQSPPSLGRVVGAESEGAAPRLRAGVICLAASGQIAACRPPPVHTTLREKIVFP